METWYIVYQTADGEAVSIGSVLANPLPAGLQTFQVPSEQIDALLSGDLRWNSATLSLIAAIV